MRTVKLACIKGYKPPKGYRIVKTRKLKDGTYEVTLEPLLMA